LKIGVKWEDMHLLAERVILEHLVKLKIVNNFPMEELVSKRIGANFFPHGLGHLIGKFENLKKTKKNYYKKR
jgi:Xaa-Pro dipeptidase